MRTVARIELPSTSAARTASFFSCFRTFITGLLDFSRNPQERATLRSGYQASILTGSHGYVGVGGARCYQHRAPRLKVVPGRGIGPLTTRLVGGCSLQLSYPGVGAVTQNTGSRPRLYLS